MQRNLFTGILVWALSVALILPAPAFSSPSHAGETPASPAALHFEGTQQDKSISVDMAEASSPAGLQKLTQAAEAAAAESAETGGKTIVLTVSNPTNGSDPLPAIAEKIASLNPNHTERITAELDQESKLALESAQGDAQRNRLNTVLTITRITGIAIGVTTIIALTYHIPFLNALPIGLIAATMSGALQAINDSFQRWLVGEGFFRIPPKGEAPASHGVTIGKLSLVTLTYLSILRGGLYAMGLEAGDFFSLENAFTIGKSVAVGTVLEYSWDRFISESLAVQVRENPHEKWKALMKADVGAATLSVIGTIAQALSVAGWTVGHIAAGTIAGAGVLSYLWSAHSELILGVTKRVTDATVGACRNLFSKISGL